MSTDLRSELNNADDVTGWTDSNKSPSLNNTVGQRYEGTGSIETQHTNSHAELDTTQTSGGGGTFSIDLSNSTYYFLVKVNLVDTFANGGVQAVLGDGTNLIGYYIGGYDAVGLSVAPFYNVYKLDVSVIVATPGSSNPYSGSEASLVQTTITRLGVGSIHLAKAVGNIANFFCDRLMYVTNGNYALRINGGTSGTPETMSNVQNDDVTNGWGMVANPLGSQYQFFAPTEWGEPTANADAYFTATDEQWYLVGDNGGGHAIGTGNFPFRVVGNTTDTISFVATSVTVINTGTRATFDLSDTNVTTLQFTGCVFTDIGTITLQVQDAGNKFFDTCVFNNCAKLLASSMDLDDCTFNGTTDADGAMLLDEDADTTSGTMTNLVFNSDGSGHAVHVRPTGAGPFAFSLDNWQFNNYATDGGTAANRAFYINPVTASADITLNILNGGDVPSLDTTGYTGTVTINNSVTVHVEGVTPGAAVTVRAAETAGTVTIGDTIFDLLADADGIAELTTFSYESAFDPTGLAVTIRARQQGLPNAALQDDNGSFTDYTTAANSTTTDDMVLYPASPVATQDSFQWGHSEQFSQLKMELSTLGTGGFSITWEYWNGAWTSLSGVTDGTSNFTASGENVVSWTLPGDWTTKTDGGLGPFYYVRARYTSGTMSTVPLGRKSKLDVTRYLPFTQNRFIVSAGLSVVASWVDDTIASF